MTQSTDIVEFQSDWYQTASLEEQQQFRDWLLTLLDTKPAVKIQFKKANGENRSMMCTTKNAPAVESRRISNTVCTVWDIEKHDWRSFKFENITNIDFQL